MINLCLYSILLRVLCVSVVFRLNDNLNVVMGQSEIVGELGDQCSAAAIATISIIEQATRGRVVDDAIAPKARIQ